MKKLVTVALFASLGFGSLAFASSHKHSDDHHKGYGNPEERVEKMAKKLSLSEEQKAEILTIMQAQHAERKKMHEAMQQSKKATHDKISQVLDEEQRKKFSKMQDKKHKEKHDDCDHD